MAETLTLLIGPLRVDSNVSAALARGRSLVQSGADILTVIAPDMVEAGPRAVKQDLFDVISGLAAEGIRVGVETSDAGTALTAASHGATVVLDPSGGRVDAFMPGVVAGADLTFIANVLPAAGMGSSGQSLEDEMNARINELLAEGVPAKNLVIDLGVGLATEPDRNWFPLRNLDAVVALGYPVMVAASRRALLNSLLPDSSSPSDRDSAVLGVSVVAVGAGVWAVRADDINRIRDSVRPVPIGHVDHSLSSVETERRPASQL